MDFKRIQLIFLIVFIMIDIFLFNMFNENRNLQTESVSQQSNSNEVLKQMQNDQISVAFTPSDKPLDGYYLAATPDNSLKNDAKNLQNQSARFSNGVLRSTIKLKWGKDSINKIMKNRFYIAHGNQYEYAKDLSNSNTIVYLQKNDNGTFYSNIYGQIRFNISSDGLVLGYTQSYLSNIKVLREKAPIISASKALYNLYQYNEIPNNSKIEWEQMYYTKLLQDNQVYIPTWVIAFTTGDSSNVQIKRINAFTGSMLNSSNTKDAINSFATN
ncbi:two-component system regulatory protein YycI [Apilactobacillus sp. TMW 2.2459]|uniref:two-component system regulatory protein YycI n=1 Tax=Apilactobacillus xinyiensis TaxID=2841032 RepID=UPI001C7CC98A|nr:two-component system regulatory protein YycI [Apilactobacillus xinyiensis]MCL0312470.1 two-component system regulatory protein YycI [Apilactobacillus xinyiensis]